ncbi:hypothetical protein SSX86_033047 [Deinandra increscens subsp. villosa]|uniref:SAM domain-containing protein n=1 Tax=Deinandra increscens subsp. villosa TaxID=3103831 RepID=A0AAP0C386_9ASTR
MLMSHMESKEQRWLNSPNVRLGESGDISSAFNYGLSDTMMNNLWVYDFNMLEESQSFQLSGFPVQESSYEYTISDPNLSYSRFLVDPQHNRENDDPNTMKVTEMTESKMIQKRVKGPRSKRCKRTVFENLWSLKSTPSIDLYGSVDNQGSAVNKRNDPLEPSFKKKKGQNLENNDLISGSVDNQGSAMSKRNDPSEPSFKKQKGQNLEYNDFISESISANGVGRWLGDVGFGRYASMFEMHEVDEEALPLLTLDDLKEMGVLAVGPRRKLYAAICRLNKQKQDMLM